MPPQTTHLAGIGSIPPHLAKTVLARLFPVLSRAIPEGRARAAERHAPRIV